MVKLKALPAAIIAGACILVAGFFLVKWILKIIKIPPPHPHQAEMDELEEPEGPTVAQQWSMRVSGRQTVRSWQAFDDDARSVIWSTNLVDWHPWGQMVGWQITDPMTNAMMFFRWEEHAGYDSK